MPKKIKARRTAQRSRKSSVRRKNKKEPRRPRVGRPAKNSPAVIANSVFALTLKPKRWCETVVSIPGKTEDNLGLMYKDLLAGYNAAMALLGKPLFASAPGTSIGLQLSNLIESLRADLLPNGFSFNIDQHIRRKRLGYHFTMYTNCPFPDFWHYFELKPIVEKLHRENGKLHDLFIILIKTFIETSGIPTWWDGGMGYAEFALEDRHGQLKHYINNKVEEDPDEGFNAEEMKERFELISSTLRAYREGQSRKYRDLIQAAGARTPNSLLRSLEKFPYQNNIVKFMKEACMLMQDPGRVGHFCYHIDEGDDMQGLEFDMQVCIIWDQYDEYTKAQSDCIDATATGCGVFAPTTHARLFKEVTKIDMSAFKKSVEWPMKLSKLWQSYAGIAEILRKNNKFKI